MPKAPPPLVLALKFVPLAVVTGNSPADNAAFPPDPAPDPEPDFEADFEPEELDEDPREEGIL